MLWIAEATTPEVAVACRNPSPVNRQFHNPTQDFRTQPAWLGGLRSWAEFDALLTQGWPVGAEKATALKQEILAEIPPPKSHRRRQRWADEGDDLDIHRVISGQLDTAWRSMRRRDDQAPRVVTIAAQVGGNAMVRPDQMFWQGAALLALTDLLEDAGYRVAVRGVAASVIPNGRHNILLSWNVKEPHEPVRADEVVVPLAHAGAFRIGGIGLDARAPFPLGEGCGRAINPSPIYDEAVARGLLDPLDVLLPTLATRGQCAAAIISALQAIECPTFQPTAA